MIKEIMALIMSIVGVCALGQLTQDYTSETNACDFSEYNTYSNATGATKIFNRCYVDVGRCIPYEKTYECHGGFIGIGQSCYELNKPETACSWSNEEICFDIRNGELC